MRITSTQLQRFADCVKLVDHQARPLSHLKKEMTSRKFPVLYDDCSKIRSDLLDATLHDVLPRQEQSIEKTRRWMPQPYHLVYFHPATRLSSLFPDGTDHLHSPGIPFNRRMWAGGDITFDDHLPFKDFAILRCNESINDVEIKGDKGNEKIFITIERKIGYMAKGPGNSLVDLDEQYDPLIENRKLVFMRERSLRLDTPANIIKYPHEPDARHKFIPSPALLFRFSALTFNAHAIHLDKRYCQEIEGYRNLLVHGPLSVVLMLQFLTEHMLYRHRVGKSRDRVITYVAYRNLAPLYAEEEMALCIRQKDEHLWETWIEGPEGGLAARASVETAEEPPMQRKRDTP
ncbi:MAG: hypothetical protein Q9171_005453 [Xanthocarpia ochracea]